ncbi:hypothetical protein F7725_020800 [Dissostichus mawsoni]|uniref:Septin-type G domain-containing protein n=1 Tax=Dissostichus mawsoni TaxID=36200 RepID=A0A7J5YE78_DISMA|nr:hypothetical protein F7725_020800 [Dissostichus mawsoni]
MFPLSVPESIPFAVIGSNTVVEAKGKRVRGRLYPWGIVEVENSAHCDFVKLRNMLVRTHMQDLKDVTRETHYENYRAHCIQSMTRMVVKERNRNKLTRESGTDFPSPRCPEWTMRQKSSSERKTRRYGALSARRTHSTNTSLNTATSTQSLSPAPRHTQSTEISLMKPSESSHR